jgi:hypothetical protein
MKPAWSSCLALVGLELLNKQILKMTPSTLHNEHWYRIYPPADEEEQAQLRGKLCLTFRTFTQTIDAFFYVEDDGRFVLII